MRPAAVLIAPIRWYQRYLSPGLPATCRYHPTCSAYAVEALEVHGAVRGSWLAVRRLLRCHPYSRRGPIDPVPEPRQRRAAGPGPAREPAAAPGSSSLVGAAVPARAVPTPGTRRVRRAAIERSSS